MSRGLTAGIAAFYLFCVLWSAILLWTTGGYQALVILTTPMAVLSAIYFIAQSGGRS